MVQQISNVRTNKQLTQNDLARITYASCLNLFSNLSMFNPWPLKIYYLAHYHYVKRINNNSYQYQLCAFTTGLKFPITLLIAMGRDCQSIQTKTLTQIQNIHSDLVCNKDGDERLLIKCWYKLIMGSYKSKLGFFLLKPKFGDNGNFVYQLVITPKPGLFPGKNE